MKGYESSAKRLREKMKEVLLIEQGTQDTVVYLTATTVITLLDKIKLLESKIEKLEASR